MINRLKGKVFCFTGKAQKTRDEMVAMAMASGALVTKSVTKATTILVIADLNSKSSKAVKARLTGIDIITPKEFFDLCGNPIPVSPPGWHDNLRCEICDRRIVWCTCSKLKEKPKTRSPDKKSGYSDKRRIQL